MSSIAGAFIGLAPVLVAVAFVLIGFVNNAVPLDQLWRPMAIAVAAALAIQAVAVFALGWVRGSFWAFVAVGIVSGLFVLAGAAVLALTLFGLVARDSKRQYRLGGLLVAGVGATLLAVVALQGVARGAFDWEPIEIAAPEIGQLQAGPSIHLLMLDGYPREDLLAELGFDNGPFLSAMADIGFEAYAGSQSNYDRTPFSILTMLSMRHLDDISELDDVAGGTADQQRVAGRALLGAPLLDELESAGYRTRVVEGPVVHVPLGGAHLETSAGTATNFELDTLQRTPLAGVAEWFGFAMGQGRDHVTTTLDLFADPPDSPSFTFAHVMAPHAPFSFLADGSPAPAPPCYPATCAIFEGRPERLGWTDAEHWQRMVEHVEHVNALLLEAVGEIVADDPDAVIVLFSDHGMRVDDDQANMHRNLILARTPGEPGLFGESPTLVNVVPMLLNAYLGAEVPLLADQLYRSDDDPWFDVEPFAP